MKSWGFEFTAYEIRKLDFEIDTIFHLLDHHRQRNRSRCTVDDFQAKGEVIWSSFVLQLLLFGFDGFYDKPHLTGVIDLVDAVFAGNGFVEEHGS